jgi:hypothetical protein
MQSQMTLSDNICTEAVVAASMQFIMCLPNFTAHEYLWADQAKKADTPPFPRKTLNAHGLHGMRCESATSIEAWSLELACCSSGHLEGRVRKLEQGRYTPAHVLQFRSLLVPRGDAAVVRRRLLPFLPYRDVHIHSRRGLRAESREISTE